MFYACVQLTPPVFHVASAAGASPSSTGCSLHWVLNSPRPPPPSSLETHARLFATLPPVPPIQCSEKFCQNPLLAFITYTTTTTLY